MIKDCRDFVEIFETPILESVPQIYLGALAFVPLSSKFLSVGDIPHLQQFFGSHLPGSVPESPSSTTIGASQVNRLHITTCLDIMAEELRFNIFTLSSSFMRNKDAQNLEALLEANMSSRLRYACRHWADRVSGLETLDVDLVGILISFFQTDFLHWLEVMSILDLLPGDVLKLVTAHVCDSMIFATMISILID